MTVVKYVEPHRDNIVLTAVFFATGLVLESLGLLLLRMFRPAVAQQVQQTIQALTSEPPLILATVVAMLVGYYLLASIAVWWFQEY